MEISKMRPVIALGAMLLAGSVAQAAVIQYTTTGQFDGLSNVKTVGSVTLTFEGATGPANASPWTFASLGTIATTGTNLEDLTGTTLTITVSQTSPGSPGNALFNTILTGTISGNTSSAVVDFGGIQVVQINNVTYQNTQALYELVPATAGGETTLQGRIDVVPEPSTTLLLATGFGMIALAGRRLKRQA
jgi:hypothetical protein